MTAHMIALTAGFTAAVSGMAALSIVWRTNHAAPRTPTWANLELLRQYDPSPTTIALRYVPLTRMPLSDVVPSLTLDPRVVRPDRFQRSAAGSVFLLEGDVFMEPQGTWITGSADATFLLDPHADAPIRLFVRNAAVQNRVTLTSGGWRQELSLAPREEHLVDLPGGGRERVLIRIASAAGARPSDVEPGNADRRRLGCWIEIR